MWLTLWQSKLRIFNFMELPFRGAPPITFGGDLIKIRFDEIKRDSFGRIERPVLVLKKPHDEIIGSLGQHFGLEMDFKFNEVSTGSFSYPKRVNGRRSMLYDQLMNGRLIQMDPYGVYVITQTEDTDDGVRKVKQVEISSLEQELVDKKVIFAEGVYNFWNPADVENTVLGMMMSGVRNWKIGNVATSLWGKYRTFAQTDTNVLSFALETLQETYGCIFLFNTYTRTVDVLDANDEVATMPVYLSHQNLIDEDKLTENSESLFTKLYVSGADGVDIRDVNPTGDSYIYNLDYYISIGDINGELADKYRAWQDTIFARQAYYKSLVALRNSAMARYVTESARLTDMQNELSTLNHTMATFADMLKKDLQADNRTYFEERSSEVGTEVGQLETDIASQKALLETIQAEYEGHIADIAAVNKELNYAYYFTDDEKDILDHYLKETDFTDTTFAVFNIDSTDPGSFASMDTATVNMTDVKWWDVECEGEHSLGAVVGGQLSLSGNGVDVTAEIVNATIDHDGSEIVASFYLGKGTNNGTAFTSGNLTCVGVVSSSNDALLAQMTKHEDTLTNDEGTVSHTAYYYTGSPSINITSGGSVYFTRNVTEYQRYSVQQELYDYAAEKAKSISMPTYMFEIECGNILYEKHFEAFKNQIQLGCGVYLQLDNDVMVKPTLLEMHVNFEKPDDYKLVFANTFQRPDQVATFKDFMTKATAANKQLDINRHNTFQNNNTTLWVDEILKTGFNAALHRITAGPEQSVVIDETGITVDSIETSMIGPDGEVMTIAPDKIVITNGMIALVERDANGNETVKMAMGHFYDDNLKSDFVGVLADVICGTLVAGKNLIIECPDVNGGVTQFKVDSSGVIINGGRFYIRTETGAFGIDANHGLMLGTEELFESVDEGFVTPTCIDPSTGEMIFDDEGWPQNVNIWMGIDGKVYIRGNIYAVDGVFNGTVYAKNGKFEGVVQASDFLDANGNSMLTDDDKFKSDYLEIKGLNVNDRFIVDENGKVTIVDGSITFSSLTDTDELYDYIDNAASEGNAEALAAANQAQKDALAATELAESAVLGSQTVADTVAKLANGEYENGTFIDKNSVKSPEIVGGNIYGTNIFAGEGSHTFAQMTESGFYVYHDQTEPNVDSTIDPKVSLNCNYSGSNIALILGAGNSDTNNYSNRFFLQKGTDRTGIYYYDAAGTLCGFTLGSDGKITVHGEIEGLSPVAVFGE